MTLTPRLVVGLIAGSMLVVGVNALAPGRSSASPASAGLPEDQKPLVDVHELMEDVVGSAYTAVKKGLSEKPADTKAWKGVRSMSLLIGESGNLLLGRRPEEAEMKDWNALSVGLREAGDELYKAAKKKDHAAAKKAYSAVVTACNKCHARFNEDGEPKIEP